MLVFYKYIPGGRSQDAANILMTVFYRPSILVASCYPVIGLQHCILINRHDEPSRFTNQTENDIDARTNEKQKALNILNMKIAITSDTLSTPSKALLE